MSHEDQLVARIADDPAFPIMCERLDKTLDQRSKVLAQTILFAKDPVDQRMVDYERGFIAGAQWFLREVAKQDQQLIFENQVQEEEEAHV